MKRKFSKILGVGLTLSLLASLLLTAAPVLADVSAAEVDLDNAADNGYDISANAQYVITFRANDELPMDDTAEIEIRFPEGTDIDTSAIAVGDITLQSESTFGNDVGPLNIGTFVAFVEDPVDSENWTATIDLDSTIVSAATISENSDIRVEFFDETIITNPDEAGMYVLEVRTSEEDEWIESEEYEIEVPEVDVLPGVVELYNPSDVLMDSETGDIAIQAMLDDALDGWTIKIGEGEYDADISTVVTNVTIEGSGDVEDIIIEGTWTIGHTDITLDNLTLDGAAANLVIDVGANDLTIQNCVLEDAAVALIDDDGSGADNPTIIEDCILNIDDEIGVDVGTAGVEITDSTFNVDDGGDGVGVLIGADATVSGCTFNGGSGVGVQVNAGDSEITDNTFDGLETAFDIAVVTATADINTNTIQNCEGVAIDVAACTLVTIHNNLITGNDDAAIIEVTADAEDIFMMFNTITDNAGDDDLLIDNNDAGEDLIVINNWWGDAAGPGDDAFSDDVESEPFLPGPITSSAIEVGLDIGLTADFEDDAGVQVDNDDADALDLVEVIGAAQYTANPVGDIDDAVAFWDVCIIDDGDVAQVTIRLYTDVTEDSELWVWGEASGEWQEVEAAVANLFGGFMWVEIDANSTPTLDDLGDLPFAVVEPPEVDELDTPDLLTPDVGADDVSLTPTFAWGAVEDADGYYFELADNANFVIPMVKLDGDLGRLIVTAYAHVGELPYSTAYYWRVKAVSGSFTPRFDNLGLPAGGSFEAEGDWASSVFITKAEPEEAIPPIVIEETPPIIIEQPDIIIPLPAATPVTPGWIYAIIGVGAVLVIALIVLIVRTRRVA